MRSGFTDQQITKVIDDIAGATIRFSDTLKSEGIADGLQETLAGGVAIGQFSELLTRSGVDVEKFNEGLEKAKKEGKEADYALQQLADLGLAKTYEEYKKVNPEVAEASKASANLEIAMANLAKKLSPLVTGVQKIVTAFVEWVTNSTFVQNAVTTLQGFLDGFNGDSIANTFTKIKEVAIEVFDFLIPYIMPVLTTVSNFVKGIIEQIVSYFETDGQQLIQAVQNAFNMIKSIIDFIMPAVLFVIQSVWGNIKGIISGALDTIIGVLRIFTGLFTGDWSKMWEGIKQTLSGALEFLWNLFSLLMIGKLLGGIKAFITSGLNFFKSFGTSVAGTFKDFINNIINLFGYFRATGSSIWTSIITTIRNIISTFVNAAKANFTGLFNSVKTTFTNIKNAITNPIQTAKNLVKGFIDEIKGFFTGLKIQLPKIKMPKFTIKNWSKNPVDWLKAMPTLGVEWYAKGGIFSKPTIFNTPNGLKGVGEAGPEAVAPISELSKMLGLDKQQKEPVVVNFNVQKMSDAELDRAFNYVNRRFGMEM